MKEPGEARGNEKRFSFRLEDQLACRYRYVAAQEMKEGDGTVLSLSSTGLMMIAKDFLKTNKEVEFTVSFPAGPFTCKGEIVDSALKWYVEDSGKEMYFKTQVRFKGISASQRAQIIQYIYACKAERRRARAKRVEDL